MREFAKFLLTRFPGLYTRILRRKKPEEYHNERIVFLNTIRNGDVVFDIGANRGNYTLFISNIVGRKGAVHAFEPIPPTFAKLQARIEASAWYDNIVLNNLAAGETPGNFIFNVPGSDDGQASMMRHRSGSWLNAREITTHRCAVTTLDEYSAHLVRQPVFIKCDVEGAEFLALKGAEKLIARERPILYLEVFPEWTRNFGYHPSELFSWIRAHGYDTFYRIDDAITKLADAKAEFDKAEWRGSIDLLCGISNVHADRFRNL